MYRILIAAFALISIAPAATAEKIDAEARAKAVAPFVDAQTVGVAHVDLTRIDAEALLNWAIETGSLEAKELEGTRRELSGWLTDLTRAGGRELYVVVNLADLPIGPPVVVVPLSAGSDAKAILATLGHADIFKPLHFDTLNQALVGGSDAALKRLRSAKPVGRPELVKAFSAAGDATAQVLLLPTPETRRVLDELLPTLPAEVGGGLTRPLTRGLLWAALSINLPPKLSVRLTIQSPDADSAQALKDLLVRVSKAVAKLPPVRDFLPDIDRLANVFAAQVEENRLTLSVRDKDVKTFLPTLVRRTYQSVQRGAIESKLHRLAIGMLNYADTYQQRLPAVASFDKGGKPLLSWRVQLLPFVDAKELYEQFHLDEPWDSPHNRKLIAHMPEVYQGPSRKLNADGKTIYLLPVGKNVAFKSGPQGPRFPADFPDGTSNTIFIVEADDAQAVPWTKPDDLTIDLENPHQGLGGHLYGGFLVGLGDGSVRFLRSTISKATLRAAFTPAGGEVLGEDW